MSLKNEFVPYEQALALKELGYTGIDLAGWCHPFKNNPNPYFRGSIDEAPYDVSAPLHQQAFRFFREKYDYWSYIYPYVQDKTWHFHIQFYDSNIWGEAFLGNNFNTYEEAELECLKKLIEIVKNGN